MQQLPDLSPLSAMQTRELQSTMKLNILPPLAFLTALQTLVLEDCP
jgi:hypothetical protein